MDGWTRTHRRSGLNEAMFVLTCFLPVVVGLPAFVAYPGPGAFVFLGITALPILVTWRRRDAGIYVGESGLRLRWLFQTRVVPWHEIYRVTVGLRTVETGLSLRDGMTSGWGESAITIITPTAGKISTPVAETRWGRRISASVVSLPADDVHALADYLDRLAAHHNGRVLTGGWEGDLY